LLERADQELGEDLSEADFREVTATDEPAQEEAFATDEGLPLTEEDHLEEEALPDEFAELSMDELSGAFNPEPEVEPENAEDKEPTEETTNETVDPPAPELAVEDTTEALLQTAPEEDSLIEDSFLQEEDFIEDSGLEATFDLDDSAGFTSEDSLTTEITSDEGEVTSKNSSVLSTDESEENSTDETPSQVAPEHVSAEITQEADDEELSSTMETLTEQGEDLPETTSEPTKQLPTEAETHGEALPEDATEQEPVKDKPVHKDGSFTPLPIKDDMSQRPPKVLPLIATLTGKNSIVFTLGSITNIGKEAGSEIKLEGMLAAKKLAAIIRSKDSFKVVRKGGGKSALKVNGDKVDSERELKDGDTLTAGSLSLKFCLVKS